MSSITAVSPAPSQTPSYSSKPGQGSSSILFSFLVVFLAIFGIFMFGGIMVHHIMARRRLLVRAQIERMKQMQLKKRKPKLWEPRAEEHKSADLPSKWKDVNVSIRSWSHRIAGIDGFRSHYPWNSNSPNLKPTDVIKRTNDCMPTFNQ